MLYQNTWLSLCVLYPLKYSSGFNITYVIQSYYIYIYIYIYIYNSLRIHEENTKENHNRIVFLYVIKTHVSLYAK